MSKKGTGMARAYSRRGFLGRGVMLGCSLAASPLLTPVTFAAAPWDNRLVVIVLRGGLDGLDLLRPWHDPEFATLRPTLARTREARFDLGDGYGIHPACAALLPMWQAGELAFVQAVSTPYRDKRSHFDGQDLLEAGTAGLTGAAGQDGWLNRMLGGMSEVETQTAYAIGADPMLLSRGAAPITNWSPDVDFVLSSQGARLLEMTQRTDPEMATAMAAAQALAAQDGDPSEFEGSVEDMIGAMDAEMDPKGKSAGRAHMRIADFAAAQLRAEARVACFSLGGWDTHGNQANTLKRPLGKLSDSLLALKAGLGAEVWQRTTILAMTEFGRTVRENGTKGTDHGTGGTMIVAGGAVRGGRIYGAWPGLQEAALYDRRDLMPMDDVRRWAGWAIRSSFGVGQQALERQIFPGVDLGEDPGLLL